MGPGAGGMTETFGTTFASGRNRGGLVGRRELLALLRDHARSALGGHGRVVLLTGEAGMGKTVTAREVAAGAERSGARVLWGSCWEEAGAPDYWPWIQVLRQVCQADDAAAAVAAGSLWASRLVPSLAGTGPRGPSDEPAESARFQLFDDVTRTLMAGAERRPLVVVLDDIQWADGPSVRLATFLAHRLATARVLLVATCRDTDVGADDPVRPLLGELARSAAALPLAPFTVDETGALMASILGADPTPSLAEEIRARTGGNPFFAQQLTRLIAAGAEPADGTGVPTAAPMGVREVIEGRLSRIDAACRDLLGTASLIGSEFGPDLLSTVTRIPEREVRTLLDEASAARIVIAPSGGLGPHRFAHGLFRDVIAASLDSGTAARRHAEIGRALEEARDRGEEIPPGRIAHHFVSALPEGLPSDAVRWAARAAADASSRLAHDEAARYWEQVVRVADASAGAHLEPGRQESLLALGEARRRAGDLLGSRQAFFRGADLARRAGDAAGLARAALGLHATGTRSWPSLLDEVVAALEEAVDALGPAAGELRAQVLAGLARELAWTGRDVERARELAAEAVAAARATGNVRTLGTCLIARHNVLWGPGNAGERLSVADEAVGLASRAGDLELLAEARLLRLTDLLEMGHHDVHAELAEFLTLAETLRQPRFRYAAMSRRAMRALLVGSLAEAEELIEAAAALGREIGEPDVDDVRIAQLWEVRTLQGRRRELLVDARRALPPDSAQRRYIEVMCLVEDGDVPGAGAHVAPLMRMGPDALPRDRGWATAMSCAAELAAAVYGDGGAIDDNDRPGGEALLDALAPFEADTVVIGAAIAARGTLAHHAGRLAALLDRPDEARGYFVRAAERHRAVGAVPWALLSRYELAALGRPEGSTKEAREELAAVAAEAERMGMSELAARAARLGREVAAPARGAFQREGRRWTLAYDGVSVQLPDAKGLHDIAALLASPGRSVPAVVLAAGGGAEGIAALRLGADAVLDERARLELRTRLDELDRELLEAEERDDPERAARVGDERDALVRELAAATGLGGRSRRLGDPSERARKAVTARIRDAIARIDARHPALGAHLEESIVTGTLCSYTPSTPTAWQL
jgi:tetratricopeptide (TPR) repeat protein